MANGDETTALTKAAGMRGSSRDRDGGCAPSWHGIGRPSGVVFDLDGTLVDTVNTRIESWLEAFGRHGIPATRQQLELMIGIDGERLAARVAAAAGMSPDDGLPKRIDRAAGEIFDRMNQAPAPLPGLHLALEAIGDHGIRWAIATSSRREQVEASVHALGLYVLPIIVDGSQGLPAKPDPDLLLLAALRIGVNPVRCWYVGDATWDMIAAVAAGMVPVAVTAGSAVDGAALIEAGASVVVSTLDELSMVIAAPSLDVDPDAGFEPSAALV